MVASVPYARSQSTLTTQSALDFLNIPLDARSAGMGDIGVASFPDAYSHMYNPSKYLFGTMDAGVAIAYSPWMRNIVKDMSISGLNGFYTIDTLQSISASFRYFNMGDMTLASMDATVMGIESPFQLAVDLAYARKLAAHFGMSLAFRYIHSDIYPRGQGYKKGNAVGADLAAYYQRDINMFNLPSRLAFGASLNNIGTKVSYYDSQNTFLPMLFKLGAGLGFDFDSSNTLMLSGELSRSLVPTSADDLDKSSLSGMFSAIGNTTLRSLMWGIGAEYGFSKLLFARAGYFHQSETFGNRQYLTFGLGVAYKIVQLDLAYLTTTNSNNNALNNTIRISLAVDIAK